MREVRREERGRDGERGKTRGEGKRGEDEKGREVRMREVR